MKDLQRRQLDRQFQKFRGFQGINRPANGWASSIRAALGIPLRYIGKKLNISPQAVKQLEQSEADQTITLKSLNNLAEGLNCRLFYVLIPETSLQQFIEEKILQKAETIVSNVDHLMILEAQQTSGIEREEAVRKVAEDLRRSKSLASIWD
jgi:predicted DNA-binding mobile mystery protein A